MGWTDPWWSIARTDTLWRLGTQRTVFGFLMFSGNIECIHPHELSSIRIELQAKCIDCLLTLDGLYSSTVQSASSSLVTKGH
jgi:hypothetical protein